MRVGREAAASTEFLAEVVKLPIIEAAFEVGASVIARGGVALEINHVGRLAVIAAAEEMVIGDFVEGGTRGVSGDMAAEAVRFAIGVDDHRHGVPTDKTFDPRFDLPVAGISGLPFGWDGVD